MKGKSFVSLFGALCLVGILSGLCSGAESKALVVKKIDFARDKDGAERISIICNQSCTPELSSVEGENPRVVMDLKGVSLIQTKTRNVNTRGKGIKRIRGYLDRKTKIFRIVLDLEPSGRFIVHPLQGPSVNTYILRIQEAALPTGQMSGEDKDSGASLQPRGMHVTILRSGPSMEREARIPGTATPSEEPGAVRAEKALPSADLGRMQLNAGEFNAAVDTFTRILATRPKDSMCYRLRGNAHDNLAERDKAVEDWTQAARLGDTAMQEYLDFLQIKWQGKPMP